VEETAKIRTLVRINCLTSNDLTRKNNHLICNDLIRKNNQATTRRNNRAKRRKRRRTSDQVEGGSLVGENLGKGGGVAEIQECEGFKLCGKMQKVD